jgi:hypothetical protein
MLTAAFTGWLQLCRQCINQGLYSTQFTECIDRKIHYGGAGSSAYGLVLTGKVGASMAAEIGTMKVSEQSMR